jgi:cytochrome c oxidase subunit 2
MLTTTRGLILPDFTLIKAYVTGCDVIHSWTIPGLGIRIDAVPGKIYSVKIPFKYLGTFVGQCSEVCGLRHAYMPISLTFLPYEYFIKIVYIQLFYTIDILFERVLYKKYI